MAVEGIIGPQPPARLADTSAMTIDPALTDAWPVPPPLPTCRVRTALWLVALARGELEPELMCAALALLDRSTPRSRS